jgi:hypothetical protein
VQTVIPEVIGERGEGGGDRGRPPR